MKYLFAVFLVLICCVRTANATSYSMDVYGGWVNVATDFIVQKNVNFRPTDLYLDKTVYVDNAGVIDTNIHLCDGCKLFLRNAGVVNADVFTANNAHVVQVVHTTDDIHAIAINEDYDIMIDGANGILLTDVFDIRGPLTDKIIVRDSVVAVNDVPWADLNVLELQGDVVFLVDDLVGLYGVPLMDNVAEDVVVSFHVKNSDSLYADVGYLDDGKLYVKRVRETDYEKIFGRDNEIGKFLNDLRVDNADDLLLEQMDAAENINSLHKIINKSVRFNPDVLHDVIRTVGADADVYDIPGKAISVSPIFVMSDNFYTVGGALNLSGMVSDNIFVQLRIHVGEVMYKSDVDEFDGVYLGGQFNAKYSFDSGAFVRMMMDLTRFDFNIGNVLYDSEKIKNPGAISLINRTDVGWDFKIKECGYFAPFLGLVNEVISIEDDVNYRLGLRGGFDAGVEINMLGIRYDYGIRMMADTMHTTSVMGRVGFWSEYDAAGGDIGLGVIWGTDTISYKISIGGNFRF